MTAVRLRVVVALLILLGLLSLPALGPWPWRGPVGIAIAYGLAPVGTAVAWFLAPRGFRWLVPVTFTALPVAIILFKVWGGRTP